MVSWDQVVHAEPRLARLLERASGLMRENPAEPWEAVYEQFKWVLEELVGWMRPQRRRGPDWLFDSRAYDVACARIRAEIRRVYGLQDVAPAPQARRVRRREVRHGR
jgi:hypothetical protein